MIDKDSNRVNCSIEEAINMTKWDKTVTWDELLKRSECEKEKPNDFAEKSQRK